MDKKILRPQAGFESGTSYTSGKDLFNAELQLVLTIGYRGTDFSGFAEQEGARTVGGELRKALAIFLRRPVAYVCAGRTDAGVHAQGQVISLPVSFSERETFSAKKIQRGLQALLPEDISVKNVEAAPQEFSARFSVVDRSYTYRIAQGQKPVLTADFTAWEPQDLNVKAMQEATRFLEGEHDFKSFCKAASSIGKNTIRMLHEVSVVEQEILGEKNIAIHVVGNAFLHNMIRIIAGSLILVGLGDREPLWIQEALFSTDRTAAGPTAPASGLCFEKATYPDGQLERW